MERKLLTVAQVIQGFRLANDASKKSQHTIDSYENTFKRFIPYIGPDTPFESISRQQIEKFLSSIQDVKNITILHHYTALAAVWTWSIKQEIVKIHVVHQITAPKPEQREIQPFTEAEFKSMLSVIARSRAYERPGKRKTNHSLPMADRNRAIFLLLLDTGLRATELCSLKFHQLDQRNQRVQVMGKGMKERSIPFSPRTAQAIWRYLTQRTDLQADDYVFVTSINRPLDRGQLLNMVEIVGKRAGVSNVHPHRFRHTFAIWYLRNGGDPYTLQRLLGHTSLDMTRRYLALAQVDLDKAHRRASPVDNWAL